MKVDKLKYSSDIDKKFSNFQLELQRVRIKLFLLYSSVHFIVILVGSLTYLFETNQLLSVYNENNSMRQQQSYEVILDDFKVKISTYSITTLVYSIGFLPIINCIGSRRKRSIVIDISLMMTILIQYGMSRSFLFVIELKSYIHFNNMILVTFVIHFLNANTSKLIFITLLYGIELSMIQLEEKFSMVLIIVCICILSCIIIFLYFLGKYDKNIFIQADLQNEDEKSKKVIMNYLPEGIAIINKEGDIIYTNKALHTILKKPRGTIANFLMNLGNKDLQDAQESAIDEVEKIKKQKTPQEIEKEIIRKRRISSWTTATIKDQLTEQLINSQIYTKSPKKVDSQTQNLILNLIKSKLGLLNQVEKQYIEQPSEVNNNNNNNNENNENANNENNMEQQQELSNGQNIPFSSAVKKFKQRFRRTISKQLALTVFTKIKLKNLAKKVQLTTIVSRFGTVKETCIDLLDALKEYCERKKLEQQLQQVDQVPQWNPFISQIKAAFNITINSTLNNKENFSSKENHNNQRKIPTNIINTKKLNSLKDVNYDFDESDYCIFMQSQITLENGEEKNLHIKMTPTLIQNEPAVILLISDNTLRKKFTQIEEVDKLRNEFLSSVTHELRTPLNCIINMLQVLRAVLLDNVKLIEEYLDPSIQSAQLLLCLISDILDFGQLKAGKLRLVDIEFDIRQSILDCVQLFSIQANNKGLYLRVDIPQDCQTKIKSDPNRIRQILINLIGNALKFTKKGGITIQVEQSEQSDKQLKISVVDTGMGIKSDNLDKLFKTFGKLDLGEYNTMNSQGVGLGLMISNKLAQLLGDQGIKVSSEIRKGSCFQFCVNDKSEQQENCNLIEDNFNNDNINNNLRMKLAQLDSNNNLFKVFRVKERAYKNLVQYQNITHKKKPENLEIITNYDKNVNDINGDVFKLQINKRRSQTEIQSPQFGKTPQNESNCNCSQVLVVDDTEFNLISIQKLFGFHGIYGEYADDGDSAIDKIINKAQSQCCKIFKCILMDCQMPIKDGFQTTREIHQLIQDQKIPQQNIYGFTAHIDTHIQDQCKLTGMNGCIAKPINIDKLKEILTQK